MSTLPPLSVQQACTAEINSVAVLCLCQDVGGITAGPSQQLPLTSETGDVSLSFPCFEYSLLNPTSMRQRKANGGEGSKLKSWSCKIWEGGRTV